MTKEGDFTLNEDDDDDGDDQEEWDGEAAWAIDGDDGEGDVKDESAAYLEFLNEEVRVVQKIMDFLSLNLSYRLRNLVQGATTMTMT